jgi:pyridoxine 4-dehydrogenase
MERIPLVNLRRPDSGPGVKAEGDQIVDIDDQMAEMIAMRNEGKIGSIGLSGVSLEGLTRVLSADIACVQNAYSLVSRETKNYSQPASLTESPGYPSSHWAECFPAGQKLQTSRR